MFDLITNNEVAVQTINTQDLLQMVNEARKAFGEPEVRNNKFIEKVEDELDGEDGYTKSATVPAGGGTPMVVITMTLKQAMCVAARESKAVRRSLINKLEELQQAVATPPVPKSMGEALRLAAELWEQKEKLALENKEMAPKADVFDRIVERNNLYNATQVAQKFGQSAIWLNKQLEALGVYNKAIKRGRVFQQWFLDKGYGIMRETETGHSQAMFYAEGEMWIIGKLTEEGLI